MKRITFLLLTYYSSIYSIAQNCSQTSYGTPAYIPINDLGTSTWNGFMGGLYPSGSNTIPSAHLTAGLLLANQIQPLDVNGNIDLVNGKIGFISIGMSNATMAFSAFAPMGNADPLKNPKVKIVDCAQGGMSSDKISLPNNPSYSSYWDTTVVNRLANAPLSAKQVQVIWYKEAYPVGNTSLLPQTYSDSLKAASIRIMHILKNKFPNAKICYLASRIYAGYATSTLNPEPYSYWQGWTMKWMIEDQINNNAALQYSGTNANSPWLCWGTYNWANGIIPRSDGLTWLCPADFNTDGTHPSVTGRQKVATKLLNFLDTDTTACWYRVGGCSLSTGIKENTFNDFVFYPNPSSGHFTIEASGYVEIYNLLGEKVFEQKLIADKTEFDISNQSKGIYYIRLIDNNKLYSQKIIVQ